MANSIIAATPGSVAGKIEDKEFDAIRKLVYNHFGINLTEQKKTLVVGRLQKVLREHCQLSINALCTNFISS